MVQEVQRALPEFLPSLFIHLIFHGQFLQSWKIARYVPILKPGKSDASIPKNLRPISLLFCLGKTFEKVHAARLANNGRLNRAISPHHYGCLSNRSALDALLTTLTACQAWLHTKPSGRTGPISPSILTNDINGTFNCVSHDQLILILRHYQLEPHLINCIVSFGGDWTLSFAFDGEVEPPAYFGAGLPQGSPLSPILFVRYASALAPGITTNPIHVETAYVDDEMLTQGTTNQAEASQQLQLWLNQQLGRATFLNIRLSPAKSKLMHLLPRTNGQARHGRDTSGITLYSTPIQAKNLVKSLGV